MAVKNWILGITAVSAAAAALTLLQTGPVRAGDAVEGELVGTLRALQHNIYGLPNDHCEDRMQTLVDHIAQAQPRFDVVSLEEHWYSPITGVGACDPSIVGKGLTRLGMSSAQMLPDRTAFNEIRGGQSFFTPHPITETYQEPFVNSRSIPLYGPVLNRMKLSDELTVDVWTLHVEANVDGCSRECRLEELDDLANDIAIFSGTEHNPILLMGDFNIGGPLTRADADARPGYADGGDFPGNHGYYDIMDELRNPVDVWLALHPDFSWFVSPYTIDPLLNSLEDGNSRERIDYIFLPQDKWYNKSDFRLVPKSIDIVRWKTAAGTPISDHFGLDATFEIRKFPHRDEPPAPRPKPHVKTKRERELDAYWRRQNREHMRSGDWRR